MVWSVRDLVYYNHYPSLVQTTLVGIIWYVPLVYFNAYVLVPKFLMEKRTVTYVVILAPMLVLVTFLTGYNLFLLFDDGYHSSKALYFFSLTGMLGSLVELILLVAVTTILVIMRDWYQKERKLKELQNKNLESELSLLKNQVNPHFLFNALNSVYVLIKRSPDAARETLAKLSEMLSHQIYDGSKEEIPLEKEIKHLENFVELEKVRHADKVSVNWAYSGNGNDKTIVPMVLLPFVENAFKHSLNSGKPTYGIDIDIKLDHNDLTFYCSNQYEPINYNPKIGGLGLENVKRRLELLYPKAHKLHISDHQGEFIVKLNLTLHDN